MATNNAINANSTTPLPIVNGGTGVNATPTAASASAFAAWNANSNLPANNHLSAYTTTATAAGTTVLTVGSTYQQFFTGSTTQTVTMPVTSTLVLGQSWLIVNNSSGVVTVQSSGGNTIVAMAPATDVIVTCILTSGTSAASWNSDYSTETVGVSSIAGTANQVIASAATGAVTLSLPQSIATSSGVTFGSVTLSTTTGIVGTTTNNNAAAGSVGEYVTSAVPVGPVALTTAVQTNITTISLTAGDWDVYGTFVAVPAGGAVITTAVVGTSSTSATVGSTGTYTQIADTNLGVPGIPAPMLRFSLASTTTIYLVGYATFAAGTVGGYGVLYARRVR
jgi:hypothetical protein